MNVNYVNVDIDRINRLAIEGKNDRDKLTELYMVYYKYFLYKSKIYGLILRRDYREILSLYNVRFMVCVKNFSLEVDNDFNKYLLSTLKNMEPTLFKGRKTLAQKYTVYIEDLLHDIEDKKYIINTNKLDIEFLLKNVKLPDRTKYILLERSKGTTFVELAKELGLTKQRIEQLYKEGIEKIRKLIKNERLILNGIKNPGDFK